MAANASRTSPSDESDCPTVPAKCLRYLPILEASRATSRAACDVIIPTTKGSAVQAVRPLVLNISIFLRYCHSHVLTSMNGAPRLKRHLFEGYGWRGTWTATRFASHWEPVGSKLEPHGRQGIPDGGSHSATAIPAHRPSNYIQSRSAQRLEPVGPVSRQLFVVPISKCVAHVVSSPVGRRMKPSVSHGGRDSPPSVDRALVPTLLRTYFLGACVNGVASIDSLQSGVNSSRHADSQRRKGASESIATPRCFRAQLDVLLWFLRIRRRQWMYQKRLVHICRQ